MLQVQAAANPKPHGQLHGGEVRSYTWTLGQAWHGSQIYLKQIGYNCFLSLLLLFVVARSYKMLCIWIATPEIKCLVSWDFPQQGLRDISIYSFILWQLVPPPRIVVHVNI